MLLAAMLVVTSAAAEAAGERIASTGASQPGAVACASCHGADGGGNEQSGFPRLAGLDAAYIESQLRAYQQGQRKNPVMAGMAAPLTDQDIRDVAAYYAALTPVSHAQPPDGAATAAGEQLASYGDMANRGLPGCFQCHGPGGLGVGGSFPPLPASRTVTCSHRSRRGNPGPAGPAGRGSATEASALRVANRRDHAVPARSRLVTRQPTMAQDWYVSELLQILPV
jgi:cytochrome c553